MKQLIKDAWSDIAIQFSILAFVFGMIFSFLVIPWQTPDELTHLQFIGMEIGNDNLAIAFDKELQLDSLRLEHNPDEKVDREQLHAVMFSKPQYKRSDVIIKQLSIGCIRHLPAIIGIQIAGIIHLPAYWVMQTAELMSLLFYIMVGYRVIKIVPYKKRLFELFMLIPMSLHQAASINYDAIMLPMCYLFVAYILYLQVQDKIGWKHIFTLLIILSVILIIKIPYILLGILVLTLPFERVSLFRTQNFKLHPILTRLVLVVIMMIGITVFLTLYKNNVYVKILSACLNNKRQTCYLLKNTVFTFGDYLVNSFVGKYGWLDTELPWRLPYIFLVLLLAFAMFKETDKMQNLKIWTRICLIMAGIGIAIIATLSMVGHTVTVTLYGWEDLSRPVDYNQAIYQIGVIGGVQGRYYLPAMLPLLVGLPEVIRTNEKWNNRFIVVVTLIMMIVSTQCLLSRYFGL